MWTILADDLTGACDTGVAFAQRGWAARVAFDPAADFGADGARILTTESRGLAENEAGQVVEAAVRALGLSSTDRIYKKIDSTLRGQPGVELAAVMRAAGITRALVSPAFPAQGRVVRDGQLFVHNVRLADTPFGRDGPQMDLLHLFGAANAGRWLKLDEIRQGAARMVEILEPAGVYVAEAETETDLAILAQAALASPVGLLCGSAGLLRAVVDQLLPGSGRLPEKPHGGPVLVVAGSFSPVTRRQIERAGAGRTRLVQPTFGELRIAMNEDGAGPGVDPAVDGGAGGQLVREIAGYLENGENVLLSAAGLEKRSGLEARIAAGLAALAAAALSRARIGGLVLTGGETAAAVCHALSCAAIDLGGEVQPGVVWGRLAGGRWTGLPVITKAGGFGDEDTLLESMRFFTG